MNEITELAEAIRRERPKPETELADALVDVLEAILTNDPDLSVPVAVDVWIGKLNDHIDRRIRRYLNGVEIVG